MRRPAIGIAAILIAAVPALSACAAGSNAETVTQGSTIDGVNTTLDGVIIRDAFVLVPDTGVSPARSDVTLHATVVNSNVTPDSVTDVTTDISSDVRADTPTTVPGFSEAESSLGTQRVSYTLGSIKQELRDGDHVLVTVHLANAGAATVNVPVVGTQPYYAPLQATTPTPAS